MRYVFGDYRLDTQLQEVCRAGQALALRPKVFQLLTYLLKHHDRVVSKAELLEQLWPGQFIGDATLNSCLKDLRQAVGDSGSTQQVVQTLRSRGYRFVAALEVQHAPCSGALPQHTMHPARETPEALPEPPGMLVPSAETMTRRCPACHQSHTPEAHFCPTCGTRLVPACGHCGQVRRELATCCPACGQPGANAPRPRPVAPGPETGGGLEQEYKHVTVLCCALTDAPARAAELGAEGMHTLMHTLLAYAQQVVQQYAGTITQWGGDGFTALFGAPVAYEDHAWRALLAARALQEHWRQPITLAGQGDALSLSVTLGLHTGAVVIGRLRHSPQPLYTATGPTTQLASQLQQLAEPGTLCMSAATYRLVQDAILVQRWERPDETVLAPPGAVYVVQGMAPPRALARGGRPLSRFVGRERELALLHERLEQARAGQGQVVSIAGEPGIGKSRLVYEFTRQLHDQAVTSGTGRCLSYGSAIPYGPVSGLLRAVCGINESDPVAVMVTALRHCLQQADMALDEWEPYLQHLLRLPVDTERLLILSPEAIKRRTFAALRHLFLALSQQQPLLLTLEDAHWIDQTSEDCFVALVDSIARASVLLLVTYRPGYRPPWLDKSYATHLALQPLPAPESRCLVQSLVPPQAVCVATLPALLSKAEGNPFFLEELAQTMLTHGDAGTSLALPDTIQGVLMARIDRLTASTRRLLQLASILGRAISVRLLGAVWDGPGELEDHLATLQHLEFLYEQVGADEPLYIFKHALTQEVAYASMLRSHRQAVHTTIGQTLETLYAGHGDDALDQLAYHYGRGSDASKAIAYLGQFGAKAAASFAHVEAVAAYHQALSHIEGLPSAQQDQCRLDLLLRQAFSLSILGRFRDILDLLVPQQTRVEHLQDPVLLGPYYFRLGMTAIYTGAFQQGIQHAQRALAAAQRCHDTAVLGMSYHLLSFASVNTGQYEQGVAYGRQAVALLEHTAAWHWLGLAYFDVGMNAMFLGEFTTALEALDRTQALGKAREDPRLQHIAESYTGWIRVMQGNWEAGLTAYQHIMAHAPDPIAELSALQCGGMAYLAQGDAVQAIALLQQVVQRTQQAQLRYTHGRAAALLGEAFLLDQQYERAQHMAQQGLAMSQETAYPYGIGLAQRVLGRLAHTQGDYPTAAQYLQAALHTFTTLQARYEVARTHLFLAELAQQQDQHDTVTAHCRAAHALFERLHIPPALAQHYPTSCKVQSQAEARPAPEILHL